MRPINLFSDTQTTPTRGMRRAIAEAEVGDEQRLADPTVNRLQERVAELLGHEAGLFLPSGTMCNAIAFRVHLRPGGDEVLLPRDSHALTAEAGGPAALSGAIVGVIDGDRGVFTAGQLAAAIRPAGDRYGPRPRLVSLEQTTFAAGRVWPLDDIRQVLGLARDHGLRTHLDGARLMNAVVASGIPAADYASGFDTAWIDFTKGLGAPVGAVLVGSNATIEEAWRYKQMWGGAMRQAGIIAAAGLYALDHHVERLADDHANAQALAEGLAELAGIEVDPASVETNMVIIETEDALGLCGQLWQAGVELTPLGPSRLRAVTHLDVSRSDVERVLAVVRKAVVGSSSLRRSA